MSEESSKPGVYWNEHIQKSVITTVARLVGDPQRQEQLWLFVKEDIKTCKNLPDFLQKFDTFGYHLDEFKVIQALLKSHGDDDGKTINPWLVLDILPRLYDSHIRSQALESTVDSISKRFSACIEDISDALYEVHPPMDGNSKRLNCLSLALQKYKKEFGGNDTNHASQPTKVPGGASTDINEDDRYTVLMERIKALEKMVQENRANMESHQPFVMVDEPAEIACQQRMRAVIQKLPSGLASDDSSSSACTLTPASTVVNEPVGESNNVDHDDVASAAPLELRVFIYINQTVNPNPTRDSSFVRPDDILVVRMHPTTPFKSLTDKLYERYGDNELRQDQSRYQYVFDSDTPASLKLTQDEVLIYAHVDSGVETIDLTMS